MAVNQTLEPRYGSRACKFGCDEHINSNSDYFCQIYSYHHQPGPKKPMRHTPILLADDGLRSVETRVIDLLRAWNTGTDAQNAMWVDLQETMGAARAKSCLQAFEQMLRLLKAHSWRALTIMPTGTKGISSDEAALARFVLASTEQRRETALAEAGFLVSPTALLPLICAASRFGLPLLCEECRARVLPRRPQTPTH